MKQCMDAENLHRRLKKIIGQVQAIDRMVDEDIPCEDILAQINAAKSALNGCGKVVLRDISSTASGTESSTATRIRPSRASPRRWSGLQICSEYTVPSGRSDGPVVLFSVLTTNTPICIMTAYPVRYRKSGHVCGGRRQLCRFSRSVRHTAAGKRGDHRRLV